MERSRISNYTVKHFLPFGWSQGSSLTDHLRQRELTTAQDFNLRILPILRKKSIMNPATL
jgi:hypothetical protein